MLFRRLGLVVLVVLGAHIATAGAAEPILLRYKFAKGDQLVYRTTREKKDVQTINGQDGESTSTEEVVTLAVVDEVDGDGNAVVKTKAVRHQRKADGQQGKFEFDSKSTERDTSSQLGAAATPLLERLTGSEYQIKVAPRGTVTEVKGFAEIIADLVKDRPESALLAGILADNESQKISEQEHFPVFSDKPVSPGDNWETPVEVTLKGLGKMKGKIAYTYEGDDKVGLRKTVRIGVKADLALEFELELGGVKITGTMKTTNSSGTIQFDPAAGRIVSIKDTASMSGPLTVDAGGMMFPIATSNDTTTTVQLLDKLPE
jgi:hypothetical protein